ncbi:DUF7373 family lipoprotein [Nocardia sp. JW2]|uniref:DUF7373 family lipoprotein n=1 Tax=Nocardia sp. JW2 TaxID=3450738 RepID=UPI003F422A82
MRKTRAYSAFAALALLLGACGDDPEPAAPPAPQVDVAKLDSGNYPTTPLDVESTRTAMSGALRESIRIAAASPTPYDYDNRFVFAARPGHAVTAEAPPWYPGTDFENGKDTSAAIPGVVAGWETAGQRREEFSAGREIDTMVVRYETADQARFAADEIGKRTKGVPGPVIPDHPEVQTRVDINKGSYTTQYLRAWLLRGDLLIHASLSDPISIPFDAAADADIVKRFFDKQLELLASYKPTPVADFGKLPLDVDGLLAHTLPAKTKESEGAAFPVQAVLHLAGSRRDKLIAAITDAGIDYASFAGGSVFRARDADAAIRYMVAEATDSTTEDHMKVDGPAEMPGAECYNAKPEVKYASDAPPMCITTIGRYVIKSQSMNLQDAQQQLAAQYKLLHGFS